jgi:hypothetical protein
MVTPILVAVIAGFQEKPKEKVDFSKIKINQFQRQQVIKVGGFDPATLIGPNSKHERGRDGSNSFELGDFVVSVAPSGWIKEFFNFSRKKLSDYRPYPFINPPVSQDEAKQKFVEACGELTGFKDFDVYPIDLYSSGNGVRTSIQYGFYAYTRVGDFIFGPEMSFDGAVNVNDGKITVMRMAEYPKIIEPRPKKMITAEEAERIGIEDFLRSSEAYQPKTVEKPKLMVTCDSLIRHYNPFIDRRGFKFKKTKGDNIGIYTYWVRMSNLIISNQDLPSGATRNTRYAIVDATNGDILFREYDLKK